MSSQEKAAADIALIKSKILLINAAVKNIHITLMGILKPVENISGELTKLGKDVAELEKFTANENEDPEFEIGEAYSRPDLSGTYIYCGDHNNNGLIFRKVNGYSKLYIEIFNVDELRKWRKVEK